MEGWLHPVRKSFLWQTQIFRGAQLVHQKLLYTSFVVCYRDGVGTTKEKEHQGDMDWTMKLRCIRAILMNLLTTYQMSFARPT